MIHDWMFARTSAVNARTVPANADTRTHTWIPAAMRGQCRAVEHAGKVGQLPGNRGSSTAQLPTTSGQLPTASGQARQENRRKTGGSKARACQSVFFDMSRLPWPVLCTRRKKTGAKPERATRRAGLLAARRTSQAAGSRLPGRTPSMPGSSGQAARKQASGHGRICCCEPDACQP